MKNAVKLDPKKLSENTQTLSNSLHSKIIGQDRAIKEIIKAYQRIESNLNPPHRPLAILLFLGPTGVGKTAVVQALAESLLGEKHCLTRIDCAEFQHSHEVSKLIGAPPGYIGHSETNSCARLTQEQIDRWQVQGKPQINILLFDEVEKAHESLFALLLGILDNGATILGNGAVTDFSKTIVIFTSNLGSKEVDGVIRSAGLGFVHTDLNNIDDKIDGISKEAAKKFFRPEFINRLDRLIVFKALSNSNLKKILDLELNAAQNRLLQTESKPVLIYSNKAKEHLLREGVSLAYGARELKRVIEKEIVSVLGSLIASKQITLGNKIYISYSHNGLNFSKLKEVNA